MKDASKFGMKVVQSLGSAQASSIAVGALSIVLDSGNIHQTERHIWATVRLPWVPGAEA